jgi:hypothetical protein
VKYLIAWVACIGIATGAALAQSSPVPSPSGPPLAPSAVVAAASTYDRQTITVTGTIKGVQTHQMQRGTMTQYQLCDTQCINVVQFGQQQGAAPAEGATQTVTGRFRASVDRGPMQATNVLMVGGGGHHGGGPPH